MNIVKGNLVRLAKKGHFDVIAHGCNCFCKQKAGIASQIMKEFNTGFSNGYALESPRTEGMYNKMGQIEGYIHHLTDNFLTLKEVDQENARKFM